jgi:hypothetical protein
VKPLTQVLLVLLRLVYLTIAPTTVVSIPTASRLSGYAILVLVRFHLNSHELVDVQAGSGALPDEFCVELGIGHAMLQYGLELVYMHGLHQVL